MTHIDLFSGIGGFAYAASQVWPDYRNLFFCEINPFCKAVLKKNFGDDVVIFDDIKTVTVEEVWKRYVQDVKSGNLLEKTGGAESVNPNTELNITTTTEKRGSNIQMKGDGNKECKSSRLTVASASAVENQNRNSLPSIINMVEEIKNEKELAAGTLFILKSSGRDSQKDSNYSATTVITQRDSMENAHTKNREVNIERVIADTEERGLRCWEAPRTSGQHSFRTQTPIDLLTGGFPCQPFSAAGKRKGRDDSRHLWPEMFRVIKTFKPRWVIGENVRGLVNIENGMALQQVFLDLESIGYAVQAFIIPACAVNAPHRRDRIWIVANSDERQGGARGISGCGKNQEAARSRTHGNADESDRHAADAEQPGLQKRCRRNAGGTGSDGGALADGSPGSAWQSTATNSRIGQRSPGGEFRGVGGQRESDAWSQPWLEVATRLCGISNGFSDWMERYFDDVILGEDYAKTTTENRTEGLRILREGILSKEIWGELGRLFQVEEAEVLLSFLRRIEVGAEKQNHLQYTGEENKSGSGMRELWRNAAYRHSPHRWEYQKQFANELEGIMPFMSHEAALDFAEKWDHIRCAYSNSTSPETDKLSKSKHREERLKALGNAIVPQVAIEIMWAIKCTETAICCAQ